MDNERQSCSKIFLIFSGASGDFFLSPFAPQVFNAELNYSLAKNQSKSIHCASYMHQILFSAVSE